MLPDLLGGSLRILPQVRFPKAYHLPSAGADVCVLRSVEGDSTKDAGLDAGALPVVPVVAVELHDQAGIGDRCVGGELAVEGCLPDVLDPEFVEEGIARYLSSRRAPRLKKRVHGQQLGALVGVGVTTGQRAVSDVVGTACAATRRPVEGRAAHLASVLCLAAALDRVVTRQRAEATTPGIEAVPRSVEGRSAPLTQPLLSSPALWPAARPVAGQRAVLLPGARSAGDRRPAPDAGDQTHLVSLKSLGHKANSTGTVNPIGVMR
jgi:hypothetical protein